MMELIKLKNLRFSYADKEVLHIPDFSMQVGQRVFLYGPSGCGKSTLLNVIAGTLPANSGEVNVCGRDMSRLSSSGRDSHRGMNIGYIFQSFNLISYLTVKENILLPAMVSRAKGDAKSANQQVEHLMEQLGLSRFSNQLAGKLSIGQRQRVAAARALMGTPKLIIADEPTSSLDEDNTNSFMQLLLDQSKAREIGVLFVSHDRRLETKFDQCFDLTKLNSVRPQ